MKLSLVPFAFLGLVACASVHRAARPDLQHPDAKDPSLVEVRTTGYDGPVRTVSYSTYDLDPNDDMPQEAPKGVVADMREEAALYGADMLLVERVEDAWRKVWLGLGVKKDELANNDIPVCGQKGFDAALEDAKKRAVKCAQSLLFDRPQLRGEITVAFEVDDQGKVLRAAPTPDSSRDSGFQQCVVGAVHETVFGEPIAFTCQGRITVDIVSPNAPAPTAK